MKIIDKRLETIANIIDNKFLSVDEKNRGEVSIYIL